MPRYHTPLALIVGLLALIWHCPVLACSDEEPTIDEVDCRRIKASVSTIAENRIIPLASTDGDVSIDPKLASEIEAIRQEVQKCAMPLKFPDQTSWNEDEFVQLDAELAYMQIILKQVAEAESPQIAEFLLNSQEFESAVHKLKVALQEEEQIQK